MTSYHELFYYRDILDFFLKIKTIQLFYTYQKSWCYSRTLCLYFTVHPHNCSSTYLFYVYFIDELAEVALTLLPFLLPQKRSKANQEEFVRFVSVRVHVFHKFYHVYNHL